MPGEAPAGCEMRPTSLSLDSEAQQQADCNTTTTSLPGSVSISGTDFFVFLMKIFFAVKFAYF